jgi:oligopeptide/dipeptide ABC transporter ATP-binding protein
VPQPPIPESAPLLQVGGVSRSFAVGSAVGGRRAHLRALRDVSIDVMRGRTTAVVGESGAGKTTVARIALLLDRPDSGTVTFDGQDVRRLHGRALRRHQRRVQAVFQNPWSSLDPRMRVGTTIGEPLVAAGNASREQIRARVAELLENVGLDRGAQDRLPRHFSGGQRQRIAIARALAPRPELIVLDEPVSALDVSVRSQVMNLLKDVQDNEGVAYLLISHDLSTVRYLAHTLIVMYLGEVVEAGSSETLFRSASHPYTRALTSAALPLRLDSADKIVLGGDLPSPVDPPSGCSFHTRCWLYEELGRPDRCRTAKPLLQTQSEHGHLAACHFASTLAGDRRGVTSG